MSKAFSSLISCRALNTFVSRNVKAGNYYFTTGLNKDILDKNPNMCFKSGGYQEDTKQYGHLWTMSGNTKPIMPSSCVRQKVVKVTTSSGKTVMATTLDTSVCTF